MFHYTRHLNPASRDPNAAAADGDAPAYQWRFGATNIGGATTSSYTRNNAQPADAGNYSVVLTNMGGSITTVKPTETFSMQDRLHRRRGEAEFVTDVGGTPAVSGAQRYDTSLDRRAGLVR